MLSRENLSSPGTDLASVSVTANLDTLPTDEREVFGDKGVVEWMKIERGNRRRVQAGGGEPIGRESSRKSQHRYRQRRACVGTAGDYKLEPRGVEGFIRC